MVLQATASDYSQGGNGQQVSHPHGTVAGEKLPRNRGVGKQLVMLAQRPALQAVIQRMLQPSPADRPSAAELLQQVNS